VFAQVCVMPPSGLLLRHGVRTETPHAELLPVLDAAHAVGDVVAPGTRKMPQPGGAACVHLHGLAIGHQT
jgi:hypothetical protein